MHMLLENQNESREKIQISLQLLSVNWRVGKNWRLNIICWIWQGRSYKAEFLIIINYVNNEIFFSSIGNFTWRLSDCEELVRVTHRGWWGWNYEDCYYG